MKKLISILLSVMLVVSGLSLSTFAADEAYYCDFDTGLLIGNHASSNSDDINCVTGDTFKLYNTSEDLYLKGWCYTVSGVAEYWFNLAGAGWEQIPESGITDRSDVFNVMAQTFDLMGIQYEPNTKSGFDYRIPLAERTLADGLNTLEVKVVTNDGSTIVVADVSFDWCDFEITDEPIGYREYDNGKTHLRLDEYRTYRDGVRTAYVTTPAVGFVEGNADYVSIYGWFSTNTEIVNYGYSINGGEIVFSGDFVEEPEPEVVAAKPYEYATRFNVKAPTADMAIGRYTVTAYCQLVDGFKLELGTMTVDVNERTEKVPGGIKSSVADFMARSAWTLSESDAFVEGADLTKGSEFFPGSTFRSEWSPRVEGGSITVKVDAESQNKYAMFNSFTAYYSDHRWNGGYTFYVDLAINEENRHGRGIHLNFANETSEDPFKLYEQWSVTEDDLSVAGNTGILVWPYNATTLKIAVLTYDDTTNTKGAAVATIDLTESGVNLTTLTKFTVVDNGNDAIFVLVADKLVAKITYADAGIFTAGGYLEGYYKTSQVLAADGTVLAETDKAIISKYKTVGLGARASTLYADNVSLAEAIDVVDTTVPADPTEITFTADSNYYMYNDTNIIVAVTSGTGFTKLPAFVANIANDSTTYKVFDNTGAEATDTTNMKTGYKLELYNADGELIETYDIALLGDVDGNGKANLTDYGKIKKSVSARTATTDFTGVYLAAADVTLYTRGQTTYRVNLTDYGDIKVFTKSLGKWTLN